MPYRLEPDRPVGEDVRRVALACIDDVRTHVDQLGTPGMDGNATETAVHETRKRCKELRGLLRLVRPALGSQYGRLNAHDRDAAKELSTLRDAQTLLDTEARHLDDLSDLLGDDHDLAVLVERLERDAHARRARRRRHRARHRPRPTSPGRSSQRRLRPRSPRVRRQVRGVRPPARVSVGGGNRRPPPRRRARHCGARAHLPRGRHARVPRRGRQLPVTDAQPERESTMLPAGSSRKAVSPELFHTADPEMHQCRSDDESEPHPVRTVTDAPGSRPKPPGNP